MALVGINPAASEPQKASTLEKIALGFSIANNAVGSILGIPKGIYELGILKEQKKDIAADREYKEKVTRPLQEADLAQKAEEQRPLSPEEKADFAKYVLEITKSDLPPTMVPNTVGEARRLTSSLFNRTVMTPAQEQATEFGKERLTLAKQTLEMTKAERERAEAERKRKQAESTSARFLAGGYGARMLSSNKTMDEVYSNYDRTAVLSGMASELPNWMPGKSEELKKLDQAERNFVNATLRRESGAVIAQTEFDNAKKQYFVQAGDTPDVIEQKRENRVQVIRTMMAEAGPDVREQVLKEGMNKYYDDLLHGKEMVVPSKADIEAEMKRRGLVPKEKP